MTRHGLEYLRGAVRQRVRQEGLRPFSARTGIPVGQLRSLLQGRAARSTTLEAMSSVMGLEFYIGPARLGRPAVPPEIAKALQLPKGAGVADAIRAIDKDVMASRLREGMGVVQDLVQQAAGAAERLPELVAGAQAARDAAGPAAAVSIIPYAADVHAEADTGGLAFDKSPEMSIAVATEALASWSRPERLTCFRAAGDSMEPTIQDGDLVAVDAGRTAPLDEELFALQVDAGLVVKRLHLAGTHWFVASDNPAYLSRPLSDHDRIVGQIAWRQPHGGSKH